MRKDRGRVSTREREEIGHPDTKVPLVSRTYNLLNMHHSIAVSSFAVASHSFHVPWKQAHTTYIELHGDRVNQH